MGHTGSTLKKFRKSLRRMSLSKSIENLKKGQSDSKMKHSKSLTNLAVRKRELINIADKDEKTLRRNTIVISSTNFEKGSNKDVETQDKENKTDEANNVQTDSKENISKKDCKQNKNVMEQLVSSVKDCSSVTALKTIDSRLKEMEDQIDQMSHEDLFVYHATFKDEIHNFWIKAYEIKESNDKVKPKKNETIEYVKRLLHKLNHKLFQRNAAADSFC